MNILPSIYPEVAAVCRHYCLDYPMESRPFGDHIECVWHEGTFVDMICGPITTRSHRLLAAEQIVEIIAAKRKAVRRMLHDDSRVLGIHMALGEHDRLLIQVKEADQGADV